MKHNIEFFEFTAEQADLILTRYQHNKAELSKYIDLLQWWNNKINLVSRNVSRETIKQHVEHSLTISESYLFQGASRVIDSGTGGGLPGIPLAILHGEKSITLNDVVSKKIMACKHMSGSLNLKNIQTSSVSVEELKFPDDAVIISKHAFKVQELLSMIRGKSWKGIILLKGKEEVEPELESVEEPLSVKIIDLNRGFKDDFYKGKAMVEITKK